MFKLLLEKAEEPETKLPTSAGSLKKQESSKKAYISALLTIPKPLTVWTKTTNRLQAIDSVRSLLEDKERQMFQIVRLMDEQQSINP